MKSKRERDPESCSDNSLIKFDNIKFQDKINAQLAELVPFAVDNRTIESPHTKTHLLFQMHFSRLPMPISDYETDLKSVLDQAVRILQVLHRNLL
jgi:hypothetical protein